MTKKSLFNALCNLIMAAIYLSFVIGYSRAFIDRHQFSVLLYAIFDTVVIFFLLVRGMPKRTSGNLVYWAASMAGSWLPLLMHPYPSTPGTSLLIIPQLLGLLISFFGLFSLNKSFAMMAANRVIRTRGIYRHIRHPLYAGYTLMTASFALQHISPWNIGLVIVHSLIQLWRIFIEEDFLSADPEYAAYMSATRWRLVPGLW